VPGLKASVTYYYIDFFGSLGSPPFTDPNLFFPNYPSFYVLNPTPAQTLAFAAQAPGGVANVASLLAGGQKIYELIDARKTNLGDAKISGLDWSIEYSHDTDFGSVDAAISGNNLLKDYLNKGPATTYINQIGFGASLFRFAATVGANIGNLRAQATLNHSQGYNVIESTNLPQTHVGSFNVVNLFFKYDLDGTGWSKDMSLSLGIDNLFDENPPVYKQYGTIPGSGGGYTNGATLSRLVQIGFSKKF
jgi:iron complex outermembrane receptor protein